MSDNSVQVEVRTTVFSLEAVYAACYAFIDRAYVHLDDGPDKVIRIVLESKKPAKDAELRVLDGEFRNELLHQALRLKVSKANRKIREYVVTRALLSSQPVPGTQAAPGPDTPSAGSHQSSKPGPDGVPVEGGGAPVEDAPKPGPDGVPNPHDCLREEPASADKDEAALAAEIEKLLAETDEETPMGITAPWEDAAAAGSAKTKSVKAKGVKAPKGVKRMKGRSKKGGSK